MAKQPKGFGQPTPSKGKKSSQPPRKTPPKNIPLSLAPLTDTEFLADKEIRLKQIFSTHTTIPPVSNRSLQDFHQYLQSQLASELQLVSEEPFDWEAPYIYGRGTSQAHQAQRHQHPSYFDRFRLIVLSELIDHRAGIQVEVQRLEDQKTFTLPLIKFKIDGALPFNQSSLADYHFWWQNYQPTYP